MKVSAPSVAPILRSDTQGLLLAALFGHPERSYSLTELAAHAGTSVPTIMREINRLVEAGYLLDSRVGHTRQIRANVEHALYKPLRAIVMHGYGPIAVLPDLLRATVDAQEAYIYGSWAARFLGEPGPEPNDIDVLVIGSEDHGELYDVARRASELLGREVSIQVMSAERWANERDGFVKTLKSRPLVKLDFG